MQYSNHANVGPHIAIKDVGEFMSNDPLKFVPAQVLDGASSDPNDRIAREITRGKGVDPGLLQ